MTQNQDYSSRLFEISAALRGVISSPLVEEIEAIAYQLGQPSRTIPPEYMPRTLLAMLGKLSEECGETVKAVGKALRFGLLSSNPDLPPEKRRTNEEAILHEMEDIEMTIPLVRKALANRHSDDDVLSLEDDASLGRVL